MDWAFNPFADVNGQERPNLTEDGKISYLAVISKDLSICSASIDTTYQWELGLAYSGVARPNSHYGGILS